MWKRKSKLKSHSISRAFGAAAAFLTATSSSAAAAAAITTSTTASTTSADTRVDLPVVERNKIAAEPEMDGDQAQTNEDIISAYADPNEATLNNEEAATTSAAGAGAAPSGGEEISHVRTVSFPPFFLLFSSSFLSKSDFTLIELIFILCCKGSDETDTNTLAESEAAASGGDYKARVLWNWAGQKADDLSLTAGGVVMLQNWDGPEWWYGSLHGQEHLFFSPCLVWILVLKKTTINNQQTGKTGWFPANYVEYLDEGGEIIDSYGEWEETESVEKTKSLRKEKPLNRSLS